LLHLPRPGKQEGKLKFHGLSRPIEDILERRFGLTTWDMAPLRYCMTDKPASPRTTRKVVVFDPEMLKGNPPGSFDDLLDHREAILFTGAMDSHGRVTLKNVSDIQWPGPIADDLSYR
jgi:hypothetical protein